MSSSCLVTAKNQTAPCPRTLGSTPSWRNPYATASATLRLAHRALPSSPNGCGRIGSTESPPRQNQNDGVPLFPPFRFISGLYLRCRSYVSQPWLKAFSGIGECWVRYQSRALLKTHRLGMWPTHALQTSTGPPAALETRGLILQTAASHCQLRTLPRATTLGTERTQSAPPRATAQVPWSRLQQMSVFEAFATSTSSQAKAQHTASDAIRQKVPRPP